MLRRAASSASAGPEQVTMHTVGFQIIACKSGDRCVLRLAEKVTAGSRSFVGEERYVMVWRNGDWRRFMAHPDQKQSHRQLDNLVQEGFIPWSP